MAFGLTSLETPSWTLNWSKELGNYCVNKWVVHQRIECSGNVVQLIQSLSMVKIRDLKSISTHISLMNFTSENFSSCFCTKTLLKSPIF